MHFEVLVEDRSGKAALEELLPRILGGRHSFKVHPYKGIGRIPKSMKDATDASKRILLLNLPKLLKGYGKTFAGYPPDFHAAVVVVCDLDDRCLKSFRQELLEILDKCQPQPETRFCFAIEEGEAWLLGDLNAVRTAFPKANSNLLNNYVNDSICGTWELLADAIHPGGARQLKSKGWHAVGQEKALWAQKIAPILSIDENKSPSFVYFRDKLRGLADEL
jgi:hypothetical protein